MTDEPSGERTGSVGDRLANDPDSFSWHARILLELADPILDSSDIRQALAQAETDSDALRDLLAAHSDDLICASTTPDLAFREKIIDWELLLARRRWRQILAAALAIWAVAIVAGVFLAPSPVLVFLVASSFAGLLFVLALIWVVMISAKARLEPAGATADVLRREVVGPFLREQINRILAEQEHFDVMRVTSAPGLADLSDREQLVSTDTMRSLAQFSGSMPSGSIGISGPRGVGKTTLLQYFCDPPPGAGDGSLEAFSSVQDLRIMVSAPVEYDTREFILHLFGRLCETILGTQQAGGLLELPSAGAPLARRRSFGFAAFLLLIFGLGVIASSLLKPKHLPRLTTADIYLCAGGLSLVAGAVMLARWARLISFFQRFTGRNAGMGDEAKNWLTRIRYLQTLTTGYAASMTTPVGPGLGTTRTRQLAELQLTLPDLVDRYREFAGRVIRWRRSQFMTGTELVHARLESQKQYANLMHRRAAILAKLSASLDSSKLTRLLAIPIVKLSDLAYRSAAAARSNVNYLRTVDVPDLSPRIVIGIDEIDKIDADSALRFLNDIKAIFGIPYCLYLVSVSDEALAVFEQRAVLGRTAFDSAFDEVIRARELDFASCSHLLRRRIAGMPDSLIAFCEVMSGGLPRDLIRTARSVVEACAQGETQIAQLTLAIVAAEIEVLKRARIAEMNTDDRSGRPHRLLRSLLKDDWPGKSARSMLAAVESDLNDTLVPLRFAAALYLYATIAEVFGSKLPATISSLRSKGPGDAGCIDRLAQARNMISVNGDVGWELISRFRAARRLRTLDRPEPAAGLSTDPEPADDPHAD